MDSCDVLIVGGGPAGSTCAWKVREAGLDAVVVDRATFPRDKVCAGWITPQAVSDLNLNLEEYRRGRTFQPITGFRVGVIGDARSVEVHYDRPVSYGIRRCEFDHYLLERSGARLQLGTPVTTIRRDGNRWIVNERIAAPVLVGAGGHFCPVARMISPASDAAPLVVAQEAEVRVADAGSLATRADVPELYFCADLKGYGWCFRKQEHFNIGLGRLDRRMLPGATESFVEYLKTCRAIPSDAAWRFHGHAYLLREPRQRRVMHDGVVLIGDAAGLAYAQSGEGIRPAIESGLLAAATIVESRGGSAAGLNAYERKLRAHRVLARASRTESRAPSALALTYARQLMRMPWFVRHVLLDRWFLRRFDLAIA